MNLFLVAVFAAAPARMVDGGVTEEEIVDVIALHANELSPCFSEPKGAKKKPSVKYRFEVNEGRVTKFALVDSVTIISDPGMVTTVKGGLDKDVIIHVIRKGESQIRSCYDSALQQHPKLNGKIAAAWEIDANGRVSTVTISEDTMEAPAVGACITTAIKTWVFPKPAGGGVANVSFPWIFKLARN